MEASEILRLCSPAYWTREEPLPVLLLMAGNPGTPDEWIDSGRAVMIADAYQKSHDGVSPIVITVDATGSFTGNPGCADGTRVRDELPSQGSS